MESLGNEAVEFYPMFHYPTISAKGQGEGYA
jgi:hypothetical protein